MYRKFWRATCPDALHELLDRHPELSDRILHAFMARRELLRQSSKFTGLRVIGSRYSQDPAAAAREDRSGVLKKFALPVVEDAGRDAVLVAQLGDRDLFEEMPAQDRDLLLGAKVAAAVFGHGVFLRSWLC